MIETEKERGEKVDGKERIIIQKRKRKRTEQRHTIQKKKKRREQRHRLAARATKQQ